ncbi:hypothetical protein MNBD_GAMMA14-1795 [hydrothermal vent metagenome]|uniref:Uncharacterized protein n=1 Tax=hydrothermal vent metagenome TaxID=652676 RepID=A0A3B0ZB40_9ZZZZ
MADLIDNVMQRGVSVANCNLAHETGDGEAAGDHEPQGVTKTFKKLQVEVDGQCSDDAKQQREPQCQ